MLKSKALSLRIRRDGKIAPSSTDRLKRVQEVERYGKGALLQVQSTASENQDLDSQEHIIIQDPVATLVRCDGNIFLCLGEVNNIRVDSHSVPSISLQDVAEADSAKITLSISILGLRRATTEDTSSEKMDWRSYRLPTERTLHVPARFVLQVNPMTVSRTLSNIFYLLEGGFLVSSAAIIFGSLTKADIKKLPQVPTGLNGFPYCEETGLLIYFCPSYFALTIINLQGRLASQFRHQSSTNFRRQWIHVPNATLICLERADLVYLHTWHPTSCTTPRLTLRTYHVGSVFVRHRSVSLF